MHTVLFSCILFFSGVIQALSGYGFGLVAVPLLLFFNILDSKEIVIFLLIASVLVNGSLLLKNAADVHRPTFLRLLVPGLIGMPFGFVLLQTLPDATTQRGMALFVLIFSLTGMLKLKASHVHNPYVQGIVGFITGILQTSIGVSAPMLASLVINLANINREEKKKLLQLFFFSLSSVMLVYIYVAQKELLSFFSVTQALALCALVLGSQLGRYLSRYLTDFWFKRLVIGVSLLALLRVL